MPVENDELDPRADFEKRYQELHAALSDMRDTWIDEPEKAEPAVVHRYLKAVDEMKNPPSSNYMTEEHPNIPKMLAVLKQKWAPVRGQVLYKNPKVISCESVLCGAYSTGTPESQAMARLKQAVLGLDPLPASDWRFFDWFYELLRQRDALEEVVKYTEPGDTNRNEIIGALPNMQQYRVGPMQDICALGLQVPIMSKMDETVKLLDALLSATVRGKINEGEFHAAHKALDAMICELAPYAALSKKKFNDANGKLHHAVIPAPTEAALPLYKRPERTAQGIMLPKLSSFNAYVWNAARAIQYFVQHVRTVCDRSDQGDFVRGHGWKGVKELAEELLLQVTPLSLLKEEHWKDQALKVGGAIGFPSDLFDLMQCGTFGVLQKHLDAGAIPNSRIEMLEHIADGFERWAQNTPTIDLQSTHTAQPELGSTETGRTIPKLVPIQIDDKNQRIILSDGTMIPCSKPSVWDAFFSLWKNRPTPIQLTKGNSRRDLPSEVKKWLKEVGLSKWADALTSQRGIGHYFDLPSDPVYLTAEVRM